MRIPIYMLFFCSYVLPTYILIDQDDVDIVAFQETLKSFLNLTDRSI